MMWWSPWQPESITGSICKYLAYPRAMYGSYWQQHCEGSWLPRSEGCPRISCVHVLIWYIAQNVYFLSLSVQVQPLERVSLSPPDSSPSVSRVPSSAISAAFLLPSPATGLTPTDWRSSGNVYTPSKSPSPRKPSVIAVHREQTWALITCFNCDILYTGVIAMVITATLNNFNLILNLFAVWGM